MRTITIALCLISVLSQAQVRINLGAGASYRLADRNYFNSMDGEISDKVLLTKSVKGSYNFYQSANHHLWIGAEYRRFGLKSSTTKHPGIIGQGSAGSHTPPHDEWYTVRWETIGIPLGYEYRWKQLSFVAEASTSFLYREVRTTIKDYRDDNVYRTDVVFMPSRFNTSNEYINLDLDVGVFRLLGANRNLSVGIKAFIVIPFSTRNYFRVTPIGLLTTASYTLKWYSKDK